MPTWNEMTRIISRHVLSGLSKFQCLLSLPWLGLKMHRHAIQCFMSIFAVKNGGKDLLSCKSFSLQVSRRVYPWSSRMSRVNLAVHVLPKLQATRTRALSPEVILFLSSSICFLSEVQVATTRAHSLSGASGRSPMPVILRSKCVCESPSNVYEAQLVPNDHVQVDTDVCSKDLSVDPQLVCVRFCSKMVSHCNVGWQQLSLSRHVGIEIVQQHHLCGIRNSNCSVVIASNKPVCWQQHCSFTSADDHPVVAQLNDQSRHERKCHKTVETSVAVDHLDGCSLTWGSSRSVRRPVEEEARGASSIDIQSC